MLNKSIALYKVAYTYAGDRVASVTEYGVQADGSFVAGPTTTYTYSIASGRTVAQTTEPADEGEANVITTVYTFADDGSLVSDYVYTEDTGRTTKVTSEKPQTDEDGNKKTDAEGNVLYEPIAHVSYAYDSFDNLTHITRGDDMGYVLTYNAYHNLQSIGVEGKEDGDLVTYTYKNGNGRLKAVTYANGHVMRASYNTAGQMVAEKWYENDTATQPIAHYKYVYDGQGNIVRSIDMTAKIEYTYTYEEGEISRAAQCAITGTNLEIAYINPFRYRSYTYDQETGLYYLQSRYYDPEVGRFVNGDETVTLKLDETILSNNLYVYCYDNPLSYIDAIGMYPKYISDQLAIAFCAGYDTKTIRILNKYKSKLKSLAVRQITVSKIQSEFYNSIAAFDQIIKTELALGGITGLFGASVTKSLSKISKFLKNLPFIGVPLSNLLSPKKIPSGTYTLFTLEAKYGVFHNCYRSRFIYITGPAKSYLLGLWVVDGKRLDKYRYGLEDFLKVMLKKK